MTSPETPTSSSSKKRSPAVIAGIVIAVIILLAGGAFVVYKLTDKKTGATAFQTADKVKVAVVNGDKAAIAKLSTPAGKVALLKLKPSAFEGMTFAGCVPFPGTPPTRVCTWNRPGGQLTLKVVLDPTWIADAVTIGPAGLPPTSSTTAAP